MADDKQMIRDLIDDWARASAAGDLEKILSLMDKDAVFLVAGRAPMRGREAFGEQFKQVIEQVRMDVSSDIQEIEVSAGILLESSDGDHDAIEGRRADATQRPHVDDL